MRLSRRQWVVGALATCGCSRRSVSVSNASGIDASIGRSAAIEALAPASANDASLRRAGSAVKLVEWDLGDRGHAVVMVVPPQGAAPDARYPLVVALHGRGESLKGSLRGAWGWPRDYSLSRAAERIVSPPLTSADYQGLVTPERLARVNARLRERPFRGLVVICPFVPDFDWSRPPDDLIESYGRFVTHELVPKARRELPVDPAPSATGIDGVSLGGAMALRVGFRFPTQFGAVGTLQGAINPGLVDGLVSQARLARRANPALALRIATSDEDAFVNTNRALSEALANAGVAREFEEHLGPHDYIWNQGPGSFELLLFHDRALGG